MSPPRITSLKDFAFAGAYRRLDAFDMPVFAGGAPKPKRAAKVRTREARVGFQSRFERLRPFKDVLSGSGKAPDLSPQARLQLITAMSFGWLRWEPFSQYPLHGGIPSPRSFFICDLLIAIPDTSGQREFLYRFRPEFHALLEEGILEGDTRICANGTITFVVAAVLERIASLYGDLSLHLSTLECGHAAQQLVFMCRAAGWPASISGTIRDSIAGGSSFWRDRDDLPLSIVRTGAKPGGLRDWIESLPLVPVRLLQHNAPLADFAGLSAALALWRESGSKEPHPSSPPHPVAPRADGDWSQEDVLSIVRRRSSGPDFVGYNSVPALLSTERKNRFYATLFRLFEMTGSQDLARLDWALHTLELRLDGQEALLGRLDFRTESVVGRPVPDLSDRFIGCLGSLAGNRTDTAHFAFVFAVDLAAALQQYGVEGITMANIAAGIMGQNICLSAASVGLCARPLRGFDELKTEALLKDGRQATYIVIVSRERSPVLQFSMEPAA